MRFRLEDEDLKKLGFDDMPAIGDVYKFTLEATPESVSMNQRSDGDEHKCVEFQITDMKWDSAAPSPKPHVDTPEEEAAETPAEEAAEDEEEE